MKKMIKSYEKNVLFDLNAYIYVYVYLILIFAKHWNYEKLIGYRLPRCFTSASKSGIHVYRMC